MKHLNTFEANINNIKNEKYFYLICWNDGYTIADEGWITTHYEEIVDDSSRLDVIQEILNLVIDEEVNNNTRTQFSNVPSNLLSSHIEWIKKIRFDTDKLNSDLIMQLTANKYNV